MQKIIIATLLAGAHSASTLDARAATTLQQKVDGQTNLLGSALRPCTQPGDQETTGYTGTGSCEWEKDDSGYHEVCVVMSQEFLQKSASEDGNDLSSVVGPGGHWCVCAWAWASSVERDPVGYEGLELVCAATNSKLRNVYESVDTLESPAGQRYESEAALKAVDELCPAQSRRNVSSAAK